jgi:large exoprotein involved in heme utilization and adhesion
VQPGKTLALVGGDVTLEGGNLTAPGGRIELGSVAGNSLVSLNPTNNGWVLGYESVQNFQNIQLIQRTVNGSEIPSSVDASGEGGAYPPFRQTRDAHWWFKYSHCYPWFTTRGN